MSSASPDAVAWTCPFCPLVCDELGVQTTAVGPVLAGAPCPRAARGLAQAAAPAGGPSVDGRPAALEAAVAEAARRLARSRQPLLAGLGTDVEGARALYPLACATGAITDAAGGDALTEGLRALQDRGQFTTTLAEVRTRADLLVFVGEPPLAATPRLRERLGLHEARGLKRHVAVLGASAAPLAGWAGAELDVEAVMADADLHETLPMLAAMLAGRLPGPAALQSLAARLRAARYAVFVGAATGLPGPAALLIETVHRVVHRLNHATRAAALWLGGGQGASTANQVFTWLGGLPLRSRAGPHGLEHEPQAFATARVVADRAADLLLWVSAFDAEARPPGGLPMVALAHPAQAAALAAPGAVVIPVGTPGVDHAGHLFRTDGTVMLPLFALREGGAPSVAAVARALLQQLPPRLQHPAALVGAA